MLGRYVIYTRQYGRWEMGRLVNKKVKFILVDKLETCKFT
jgi:hypothetical protein